jgi:predicted DNA binding CopG/RHH family protein
MLRNNSLLEFYSGLFTCFYHDVVTASVSQREIRRDVEEIQRRVRAEGLSFLTKTLPRLGKAIDRSLARGIALQSPNFKRRKGTQLPAFCWTLFNAVFSVDGLPLHSRGSACRDGNRGLAPQLGNQLPDANQALAVKALRQICYACYKLNIPYDAEQENQVITDFVKTDLECPESFASLEADDSMVLRVARRLVWRVCNSVSPYSGIPKHGPGAVATGESQSEKHRFSRYYERLASCYPYDQWFFANGSHLCDSLGELQSMESLEYGTAKVVLVPKDSRGPRLISCEPLEYQWIQQAQKDVLVAVLEKHPLTAGRVNFTHQSINRDLALQSSISGEFVTLDMKEASDRVSLALVRELFPPLWYDALWASRTPATRLPDGTVHQMRKFAPMGSAVCFPVESLVFWALCVATLEVKRNTRPREAAASVYVYGDDIVCRSEDYAAIDSTLPKFGLKLNEDKCCVSGFFRESCGMDAFAGYPVTPVRIRTPWSYQQKPKVLASYVALSNELYEREYWGTAHYIFEAIQKIWKGSIPVVSNKDIGCIAFVRPTWCRTTLNHAQWRYNSNYQRTEVRGFRLRGTSEMTDLEGWPLFTRLITEVERNSPSSRDEGATDEWKPLNAEPPKPPTGTYPIAHRDTLSRAWTAAPL